MEQKKEKQYVSDNAQLMAEWNFEKNFPLLPSNFHTQSNKKVWWKCEKDHEWQASIAHRYNGRSCPFCKGKKILVGYNDLATTHSDLCNEWDYKKNKHLKPTDVSKGTDKYVWWICPLGHSWNAYIPSRVSGTGCPICSKERHTSFPEKAIFFYLQKNFNNVIPNYKSEKLGSFEIDIYLPDYNIGVEYDGEMWHKDITRDLIKNKLCKENGISLIRIREPQCPDLPDNFSYNIFNKNKKTGLSACIVELLEYLELKTDQHLNTNVDLQFDSPNILSLALTLPKNNSIVSTHPELLQEWDYNKNIGIQPESFSSGSDKKIWWICSLQHSYSSSISSKVRGRGCPICSGKKVLKGFNDFASRYPDLAEEWDYERNTNNPDEIAFGSDKKVWWKCPKGHSYESSINNRKSGNSCPICSGKKVLAGVNDILTTHPNIVKDWDYSKNIIKPTEVSAGSHKEVFWKCTVCNYEWKKPVYYRCSYVSSCPQCRKTQRNKP